MDRKNKRFYEFDKVTEVLMTRSIKCKCGHKTMIPPNQDKEICYWCGNYIYIDKQTEFKEKMKSQLKRQK